MNLDVMRRKTSRDRPERILYRDVLESGYLPLISQHDKASEYSLCKHCGCLIILLICIESDKIPLLHKLTKLYKCFPVGFLTDIAYTANNILYKLYTKMAVCF